MSGPVRVRYASPQAWRRVRRAIGPGEARDLAEDIAAVLVAEGARDVNADSILYALTGAPWDRYPQG